MLVSLFRDKYIKVYTNQKVKKSIWFWCGILTDDNTTMGLLCFGNNIKKKPQLMIYYFIQQYTQSHNICMSWIYCCFNLTISLNVFITIDVFPVRILDGFRAKEEARAFKNDEFFIKLMVAFSIFLFMKIWWTRGVNCMVEGMRVPIIHKDKFKDLQYSMLCVRENHRTMQKVVELLCLEPCTIFIVLLLII